MRIKITVKCNKIPFLYRNRVQAYIKQALCKSSQYYQENLYNNQKPKKFTFTVNFGKKEEYFITDEWLLLNTDNMMKVKVFNFKRREFHIYVSSNDDDFMINLISGLRNFPLFYFSNPETKVFTLNHEPITFEFKKILPVDEKEINSDEIIFKTQSPFVFENINDKPVIFSDHEFENQINKTMSKVLEKDLSIKIQPVDLRKTVIKHTFSEILKTEKPLFFLTGNEGTFKIKSDIETLKYIYQCGFGVRTSQGFGMLDIIS